MNRRGFLGSIAAVVVGAKAKLLTAPSGIAREEFTPTLKDPFPAFNERIVGMALESGIMGEVIVVETNRYRRYPHSGTNQSGTCELVTSAPVRVGDFLYVDADGHVRPVTRMTSSPTA